MGDPESGRANDKEGRANNEEERASDEEGARIPAIPAPLLSRGMWAARFCSMEEFWREKHQGVPRRWEAQPVRRKNEPQRGLWFVFASPSLIPPPH